MPRCPHLPVCAHHDIAISAVTCLFPEPNVYQPKSEISRIHLLFLVCIVGVQIHGEALSKQCLSLEMMSVLFGYSKALSFINNGDRLGLVSFLCKVKLPFLQPLMASPPSYLLRGCLAPGGR